MKRLSAIIALVLAVAATAGAKELEMRKAIMQFVKNCPTQSKRNSFTSGVDKDVYKWRVDYWSCTIDPKDSAAFDPIIKACEADQARSDINFATYTEGSGPSYIIHYSERMPPVDLGRSFGGPEARLVIVSGTESKDVNTVCGVEWVKFDAEEYDGEIIGCNIYIVERNIDYARTLGTGRNDGDEVDIETSNQSDKGMPTNQSDNLRRMKFYAKKYNEVASVAGGSSIIKAMLLVTDEVIRKGTADDKAEAKSILDEMIVVTPAESNFVVESQKRDARENSATLLNLLRRLEAAGQTVKMASTPRTFRIEGTLDEGLWDVGYYIYLSDESLTSFSSEPEVANVTGGRFTYQTELDHICLGRIRPLMKDGTVGSSWMEVLFVPGETLELDVHNGDFTFYSQPQTFYDQWDAAVALIRKAWDEEKYHTEEELEQSVLRTLAQYRDCPAFFVYAFKEKFLINKQNLQKAYDLLPKETKESPYGVFLRRYL